MKIKKITFANHLIGLTILAAVTASSSMGRGSADRNSAAMISVAGGIAMPSFSTSLNTNAAGIVQTPGTNLLLQAETDSNFSNALLSAGVGYGNDTVGLGAGANYGTDNSSTSAYFGLGFAIPGIHTMLGFSGTMGLSPSNGIGIDAGLLIMPSDAVSLGFTAIGLNNSGGIGEFGAGIGFNINQNVAIAVDTAFSNDFDFRVIEPGLKVGTGNAALMLAYGYGSGSSQLTSDTFVLGASLKFRLILWEIYYNKFATFYTGFAIQL